MIRRRHRRSKAEVELNLAAMLDMAFQLLAFFILTFRPSPVEGQLALHLPPPRPVTNVEAPVDQAGDPNAMAAARSLVITAHADGKGRVADVRVGVGVSFKGPATPANLLRLDRQLRDVLGLAGTPYDQVLLRIAPNLRYEELMKLIDVCTRQKLPDGQRLQKISFVELPETGGSEP